MKKIIREKIHELTSESIDKIGVFETIILKIESVSILVASLSMSMPKNEYEMFKLVFLEMFKAELLRIERLSEKHKQENKNPLDKTKENLDGVISNILKKGNK